MIKGLFFRKKSENFNKIDVEMKDFHLFEKEGSERCENGIMWLMFCRFH